MENTTSPGSSCCLLTRSYKSSTGQARSKNDVRLLGVIQLRKRHGLRRSARSQRPTVRAEMAATTPKLTSIVASKAALKRLNGAGIEATFGGGATSEQAGVVTAPDGASRGGSGSGRTTETTGVWTDSADSRVRGGKDAGPVRFAPLHGSLRSEFGGLYRGGLRFWIAARP